MNDIMCGQGSDGLPWPGHAQVLSQLLALPLSEAFWDWGGSGQVPCCATHLDFAHYCSNNPESIFDRVIWLFFVPEALKELIFKKLINKCLSSPFCSLHWMLVEFSLKSKNDALCSWISRINYVFVNWILFPFFWPSTHIENKIWG